jgi:plastocyanin
MRRLASLVVVLLACAAQAASTQDKTPSLDSPLATSPGSLDFFFSHDFAITGPKLINSPTFNLEAGIVPRLSVLVQYASSSDINGRVNEAFPALKLELFSQARTQPFDLTAIAGYDTAASSVDGELLASKTFGILRPFLAARGFSKGYGVGGATFAGAVGLALRVLPKLSLVGDVGKVLAAHDLGAIQAQNDSVAWSGGVAFQIPNTPHSVSFFVTNVNTHTPEGASRGGFEAWRFGFEFDVPIANLARYASIFSSEPEPAAAAAPTAATAATTAPTAASTAPEQGAGAPDQTVVRVEISKMRFGPAELTVKAGTTVEWVNQDTVPHTATAKDRSWSSGMVSQGQSWRRTFPAPGRYPYFCEVHPFMKGTVVVQ